MAYPYYQQAAKPGWGTNQYQFGPPPAPSFQPQSTWGGLDFYRAHAPSQDPSLFNHAWDRVRQLDGANGDGLGVGVHEARHWHRRAYGGMNELSMMSPVEIGHAAAYEAYRTWMHNHSMYEPLGPDVERQREGLIGLAVAEASRLLSFAGRGMDQYARSTASDAAAHTASYIFYQRRQDDEYSNFHHRRGRSQSRSHYEDYDDEPYGYDDEMDYHDSDSYRHGGRSRSRHRSRSRPRSFSGHMPYESTPYPSSASLSLPHGAYPGQSVSYAGSAGGMVPPPLSASGHPTSGYYPNTYGANPNPYGYGSSMQMSGYPGHGQPIAVPIGQTMSSGPAYSYGQPYMGSVGSAVSSGSMGSMPAGGVPSQTIVIHKSRRHKHHHHRSD